VHPARAFPPRAPFSFPRRTFRGSRSARVATAPFSLASMACLPFLFLRTFCAAFFFGSPSSDFFRGVFSRPIISSCLIPDGLVFMLFVCVRKKPRPSLPVPPLDLISFIPLQDSSLFYFSVSMFPRLTFLDPYDLRFRGERLPWRGWSHNFFKCSPVQPRSPARWTEISKPPSPARRTSSPAEVPAVSAARPSPFVLCPLHGRFCLFFAHHAAAPARRGTIPLCNASSSVPSLKAPGEAPITHRDRLNPLMRPSQPPGAPLLSMDVFRRAEVDLRFSDFPSHPRLSTHFQQWVLGGGVKLSCQFCTCSPPSSRMLFVCFRRCLAQIQGGSFTFHLDSAIDKVSVDESPQCAGSPHLSKVVFRLSRARHPQTPEPFSMFQLPTF